MIADFLDYILKSTNLFDFFFLTNFNLQCSAMFFEGFYIKFDLIYEMGFIPGHYNYFGA